MKHKITAFEIKVRKKGSDQIKSLFTTKAQLEQNNKTVGLNLHGPLNWIRLEELL